MPFLELMDFCGEELQRTGRFIATAYRWLRYLDEFAMASLLTFFGDR